MMMGPPAQVDRLLEAVGPCRAALPALRLTFDAAAGGTFEMVLTSKDYAEVSGDNCAIAIQALELPATFGPLWVLGQTALRKYYSVYDARRWRVGVGLAAHTAVKRAPAPGPSPAPAKPGEVCEDDNKNMVWNHLPGCHSFAAMGYCERFAPLSQRYCRLSCELCTLRAPAAQAPSSSTSSATTAQQEALSVTAVPTLALRDVRGEDGAGARVEGTGFRISREQRGVIRRVSQSSPAPDRQTWLLSR